jgi:hypothetical protein
MTVLDSVVTVNKLEGTVLDSVMKSVVVDTVIDLFVHCAGVVSQRIMKSAHIIPEYTLCTINDIATMVGSVSFAKSMRNALITASIHAANWLLVAMFDALSSSLSKVQARCMATYRLSTVCKTKSTRTICIDRMVASVVLTSSR